MSRIFEGERRPFAHLIDADQDRWISQRTSEIPEKVQRQMMSKCLLIKSFKSTLHSAKNEKRSVNSN